MTLVHKRWRQVSCDEVELDACEAFLDGFVEHGHVLELHVFACPACDVHDFVDVFLIEQSQRQLGHNAINGVHVFFAFCGIAIDHSKPGIVYGLEVLTEQRIDFKAGKLTMFGQQLEDFTCDHACTCTEFHDIDTIFNAGCQTPGQPSGTLREGPYLFGI